MPTKNSDNFDKHEFQFAETEEEQDFLESALEEEILTPEELKNIL